MMPMSQVRAVGLDGATGDVLIGQAADAARSILETVIAQTRQAGYGSSQGFVWAVTVIAERTGGVTAWLATSEGPSYIPRGVRVPDDVRLAVTDQVVGRQLDVLETADGRKIPGEFFPHLLKEFPAIRRFQVVQRDPSLITLRLVTSEAFTDSDRAMLTAEVMQKTGTETEIVLDFVDEIPLTRAGKLKVVVRELPDDVPADVSATEAVEPGAEAGGRPEASPSETPILPG